MGLSLAQVATGEVSTDTIRFVNENEPQHERAICQIDFLSMPALSLIVSIRFDSIRLGSIGLGADVDNS